MDTVLRGNAGALLSVLNPHFFLVLSASLQGNEILRPGRFPGWNPNGRACRRRDGVVRPGTYPRVARRPWRLRANNLLNRTRVWSNEGVAHAVN